jgi:acyl-CoA thioester hydrolase
MERIADHFFEYKIKVFPADIDTMGHANNVVYLRWVQEAAAAHWNYKFAIDMPGLYCATKLITCSHHSPVKN